uniref:Centromere protein J C-terminal domain-containing protein n=1 Tax=Anas platyrhynchos TaxID=8839 RepID=A0A8B9QQW3_ANAPL
MTIITFFNCDVNKIVPDQRVIYYYADAQATHTAYPGGLEVLQFPNNQIEKHYPDGTQEIVFPDHTVNNRQCLLINLLVTIAFRNGDKTVVFSNGQKEIHTAVQEEGYSSGRVRVKDEEGNIILDKRRFLPSKGCTKCSYAVFLQH